jgi:hypothetical protein
METSMKSYSLQSRKMIYRVFKIANHVYDPAIVDIAYSEATFNYVIIKSLFKIIAMDFFNKYDPVH